ncbi:MAG: flagellar motor protein MotB [Clostridiales bacterium]|jgi:chemotaxis protein MotB|nr:flagellar motor protein MotB [Clostridiales bacterium]
MKRKKGSASNPNAVLPGYMASYADMFTVLFAFFVLMYSMSQTDQELFERFQASFAAATGRADSVNVGMGGDTLISAGSDILPQPQPPIIGAPGDDVGTGDPGSGSAGGVEHQGDTAGDMMNTFMTYMADILPVEPGNNENPGQVGPYTVEIGENYIRIRMDDYGGVFFNSGQARLTPDAIVSLNNLGPVLKDFESRGNGIIVEGHTDTRPINSAVFPSNWTLSGARASSVVEHLVVNHEIDVQMIAGLGRGEYFPLDTNNTPEAHARNRRVEITIYTQEVTAGGVIGGWFSIPGT